MNPINIHNDRYSIIFPVDLIVNHQSISVFSMTSQPPPREAPHPYLQALSGFHQKRQTVEGSDDPLRNPSSSGMHVVPQPATSSNPSTQALAGSRKRSDHRKGGHKVVKGLHAPHISASTPEVQLPSGGYLQLDPRMVKVVFPLCFSFYTLIVFLRRNLLAGPHTPPIPYKPRLLCLLTRHLLASAVRMDRP